MKTLAGETFPINGHRIIEASAGTGKTYTITNLYLRLLLGDDDGQERPLRVDEILVLTFTIAATAELRRRIRTRIAEARTALKQGDSKDPLLRSLVNRHREDDRASRLLSAALQLMDEAAIFTIHGFCARVLTEQAFETGVLFDQELGTDRDALLRQAVEDSFRAEILSLPADRRAIALSLWSDPESLEQAIKGFLFRPNLELTPPQQDLTELEASLQERIAHVKTLWLQDDIPALLRASGIHRGSRTIRHLDEVTAFCQGDSDRFDGWEDWTTWTIENKLTQKGVMPGHEIFPLIDGIHRDAEIYRQRLTANLWHSVISDVNERMERFKTELGELTLDDLLTQVEKALSRPASGPVLARRLAARWPVAMVDEFQDTDDVQYAIFSRIYRQNRHRTLLFIGDPKQAIYQFRGADIYTYINARRQVDIEKDLYSLDTNWRSSAPLIEAVNILFDQPNIFLNDRDIPFTSVQPAPDAAAKRLTVAGNEVAPVTLTHFHGDKDLTRDEARTLAMAHAAEETARLLNGGAKGDVVIDDDPLRAGQIAFLVRDRNDAAAARHALRERGIASVHVTLESVFLSDTATDLKAILAAVLEPTNDSAIRAALATPLLKCTAAEIDALNHDVIYQQQILDEFLQYHHLWTTRDVAPMIESLVQKRNIAGKWLGQPDGERQLTNLRHLAELLQKRSDQAPGMHRLLKWFSRERRDAETVSIEERQLRLESDRNLVQIITMHAAKGLEYDLVMVPMAGFRGRQSAKEPALYHEETADGFKPVVDLIASDESVDKAARERLAEDMRLLYVAITRAKYKCYIGLPQTSDLPDTAVGKLLGLQPTDAGGDGLHAHLERHYYTPHFLVEAVTDVAQHTDYEPAHHAKALRPPDAPPRVMDRWRLHSYTSIASLIPNSEQMTLTPVAGYGDDDATSTWSLRGEFNRFNFPRGPRIGIVLHALFENLDFQAGRETLKAACDRALTRIGMTGNRDQWLEVLYTWIADTLTTPLAIDTPGLSLARIEPARRLAEMEFHFPLTPSGDIIDVARKFGYLEGVTAAGIDSLEGMMTGLIDLVIEHDDKFWLIDYKSNHLGNDFADYAHQQLSDAVTAHHYDLQYLIYCVALDRYLAARIEDYRYDRDFGGVLYLFLRGMDGSTPGSGVWHDKPDPQLIAALDHVLGGRL